MKMSEARGFISYDTPDGLGVRAQVKVTKGSLPIKSIRKNDDGSMAQISFDHEAAGLNFPIQGHLPCDTDAFKAAEAAKESGEPVAFRIETQRKKSVDRRSAFPPAKDSDKRDGVSYMDIQGGKDVVKKIVLIADKPTSELRTDVNEDARWMSLPAAGAPAFLDENPVAAAGAGLDPQVALAQYAEAVKAGLPQEMTRLIGALAIAAGASISEFTAVAKQAAAA
jgi:hypothetical protein